MCQAAIQNVPLEIYPVSLISRNLLQTHPNTKENIHLL